MKKHWLLLSIVGLILFFLGICLDKWVGNWSMITLKAEIDVFSAVVGLISIGSTLLIAFWVTSVLEKRNADSRTEKDIIIKHIDLLYPIVEEVRGKVREGKINYSLAASSIKRLNINLAAVVVCMVQASLDTKENHETLIAPEIKELRDLLTNTIAGDMNLVVTDGVITISAGRQVLIEVQMDKVRNEIFKFELAINKA